MRFELTLNRTTKQRMLPMDYQYYISAWIYKVLKQADAEFASFLHEKGYGQSETKLYKLFCFSRLNFGKPKLWKEKKLFEIAAHEIRLQISFDVNEAATNFIKGLFMQQEFYLGDKFNGIDFKVSNVAALPEPDFNETMNYRLQTPWVVSYKTDTDKHPQYLSPKDEMFKTLAIKHLVEKHNNTRSEKNIHTEQIKLELESNFKRAGFVMKPGTKEQSRIVGNLFEFELSAPAAVQQMIWNAGVCEKSSSGFGWVEVSPISVPSISDRVSNSVRVQNTKIGTPSQQFAKLFNAYAQVFNKWTGTRGPLFERPFKRKKADNIHYLKRLVLYVHQNPIHHGFCEHPLEYPWSSYLSCISIKPTKLKRDEVIGWFDDKANFITTHGEKMDFEDLEEWLGFG